MMCAIMVMVFFCLACGDIESLWSCLGRQKIKSSSIMDGVHVYKL